MGKKRQDNVSKVKDFKENQASRQLPTSLKPQNPLADTPRTEKKENTQDSRNKGKRDSG